MGTTRTASLVATLLLAAGLAVVATAAPAAADAVIFVTTTADDVDGGDGVISLREAVDQAGTGDDETEVVLANDTTYVLDDCTAGDLDYAAAADEDLVLSTGLGANARIEQTCPGERILEVSNGADLLVRRITFTGGDGADDGGALRVHGSPVGSTTLQEALVLENGGRAVIGFGPVTVEDSTFIDNQELGALEGLGTSIDVRRSTFTGNGSLQEEAVGGAVYASSTFTVLTVEDSTFLDNQATRGGAIFNFFHDTVVTDSTFVGNDAESGGGAIYTQNAPTDLDLAHVTFDANTGGTLPSHAADVQVGGVLTSRATIFGESTNGTMPCALVGAPVSEGGNYEEGDDSCGLGGGQDVQNGSDPLLGPLQDNGGTTETLLPGVGSPLIDLVDPLDCGDGEDQVGTARPVDGDFDGEDGCDTGAVERPQPQAFTDVGPSHTFFTEIGWMALHGISTGSLPGPTYKPSAPVSRQAMSAFLYRLAGEPTFDAPDDPTFSDVALSNPFFLEIEWMNAEGITTGFGGGLFRPSAAVTRQSMSAFMYRMAGEPDGPFPNPGFTDVSATHQFFLEISWMADAGVTTGFPGPPLTYRPSIPVSRQAMAAFMQRLAPLLAP